MAAKRVLLKLSGESLSDGSSSISANSLLRTVNEIKSAVTCSRVQLAVVIGAGNIWRGACKFIERVTADKMGMLVTVMNSLALSDALAKAGMKSNLFSANGVSGFAENFNREKVIRCIEQGNTTVIFAGGTGNPFFTTDTTAALRAAEIKADMLLKATQVDGVYSADPKKNKDAVKFNSLTFKEALDKHLKIMDYEAFSLCMQTNISITVFDFYKDGNLKKVLNGEKVGTIVEA
ncbi:uridylate kinase [Endomicrobiia bacterium]|uniref:Uridylate kinase n=1 Tax=Endomicrobium trichonymphae TaxID=1408204 RepID=B1H055_ENDTX|nr:UMP kinase [Candidatus Endomicrobium trichonymphae]GHT03841.1 uridylate kinase [Endomicrobiia bacterium]BAG13887.1 uridylate kinase [Candidatus Endomicrobium trichonymphae]BAV59034.1 uridylate kinase [Candidatus Endomicrobium trichonymphae]GHT09063.1 uridylate kinase [Endomicrobiia bacterium]GHT11202.1 uridylate kinase [Endomicrobiia bacterium]